jgi:hypothetical protein
MARNVVTGGLPVPTFDESTDGWQCLVVKVPSNAYWRAYVRGALQRLGFTYMYVSTEDYYEGARIGNLIAESMNYDDPCGCNDSQSARELALQQRKILAQLDKANQKLDALLAAYDGTNGSLNVPDSASSDATISQWCTAWEYLTYVLFRDVRNQIDDVFRNPITLGSAGIAVSTLTAPQALPAISGLLALPAPAETLLIPATVGAGEAVGVVSLSMVAIPAALIIAAIGAIEIASVYDGLSNQEFVQQVACNIRAYMLGKDITQANIASAFQYASEHIKDVPQLSVAGYGVACLLAKAYVEYGLNFELALIAIGSALHLNNGVSDAACACGDVGTDIWDFSTGADRGWQAIYANGGYYATLGASGWSGRHANEGGYYQAQIYLASYGRRVINVRLYIDDVSGVGDVNILRVNGSQQHLQSNPSVITSANGKYYQWTSLTEDYADLRVIANSSEDDNIVITRIEVDYAL